MNPEYAGFTKSVCHAPYALPTFPKHLASLTRGIERLPISMWIQRNGYRVWI